MTQPKSTYFYQAVVLYWFAYISFQLYLSAHLLIDYNDAFGFLHNARRLAGLHIGYVPIRSPMVTLLHVPLQKLMDWYQAGDEARLLLPHLFQTVLSAGCLFFFYRWLRVHFSPGWAQMGTILFSLNRMTIHYFPFVMSDIPAAFFLILFFYFWRDPCSLLAPSLKSKSSGQKTDYMTVATLGAMTACLLTRWNMIIVPPIVLLLRGWRSLGVGRRQWSDLMRLGLVLGAAGVLFFWINAAVYWSVSPMRWLESLRYFIGVLQSQFQNQRTPEPVTEYIESLFVSSGWVVPLLFAWGTFLAWRKKAGYEIFHAGFFLIFFLLMSFMVGHKESRYLFPALPSFYFVAVLGIREAGAWIRKEAAPLIRAAAIAAVALSVAWPAYQEVIQWMDPIYRSPILLKTTALARENAGPHANYFWSGVAYSSVSENYRFTSGDDYYYLYHIPSGSSFVYLAGILPSNLGETKPKSGDIGIEVPQRLFVLNSPLPPSENQIRILKFERGAWDIIATLR